MKIINKRIVREFGEREVKPLKDQNGKLLSSKPVLFLDKHATDGKHVRYRDGVVANTNGAKFIVEKDPNEDYDGGSRGRVKSKGKRGVGWTS